MREVPAGRSAKQLLNELYAKQIGTPIFSNEQDSVLPGSTFTGSVELPGISTFFDRVKFTGKARSKKLAEQTAAEIAVAWVQKTAPGLIPRPSAFPNPFAHEEKLQKTLEELSLMSQDLQKIRESSTSARVQPLPEAQLKSELEALDHDDLEKPQLIKMLLELESENKVLRQALMKEREVRKQVAALVADQPTGLPAAVNST